MRGACRTERLAVSFELARTEEGEPNVGGRAERVLSSRCLLGSGAVSLRPALAFERIPSAWMEPEVSATSLY